MFIDKKQRHELIRHTQYEKNYHDTQRDLAAEEYASNNVDSSLRQPLKKSIFAL